MPQVDVPPWRDDIVGEACLVEEVVRVYGYDRIPTTAMTRETALPKPALSAGTAVAERARGARLAGRGLVEAVTYSFVSSDLAALFGGRSEALRLVNPISADLDVMRPSPLPNLIAAAGRNADRGLSDAALFEVGPQYAGDAPEDQQMVAAGIRSGPHRTAQLGPAAAAGGRVRRQGRRACRAGGLGGPRRQTAASPPTRRTGTIPAGRACCGSARKPCWRGSGTATPGC